MFEARKMPGLGGEKYIPFDERDGDISVVYFTRDLSPEGLAKVYRKVNENNKRNNSNKSKGTQGAKKARAIAPGPICVPMVHPTVWMGSSFPELIYVS